MWVNIARIILRYRVALLCIVAALTVFMVYHARKVHLSYEYIALLPQDDSAFVQYQAFKEIFGQDANMLIIGIQSDSFFNLSQFNDFLDLNDSLRTLSGVEGILSAAQALRLEGSRIVPYFAERPQSQHELDSLAADLKQQQLYRGLLFNDSTHVYTMALTISQEILDGPAREPLIDSIKKMVDRFAHAHNAQVHYTGMPYIRTKLSLKLQTELKFFIIFAGLVCALILYLFFRSWRTVFFSMLVVGFGVVFTAGLMGLFGYSISILNAMLPPLIIVITVPNCIYFLNKYNQEYAHHGNKIKALQRVIIKVGNSIFIANLITAISFGTFIVTNSHLLTQFGIIASLGILISMTLSLILIPIIFSYLAPPNTKKLRYLDAPFIHIIIRNVINIVTNHRKKVYLVAAACGVLSVWGISRLQTTGYMVDDLPQKDTLMIDLKFMESQFKGALPLEFKITSPEKINFLNNKDFMQRLDEFQSRLAAHPEISKPLSILDVIKFSWQAHNHGDPDYYTLPSSMDMFYKNKMKKLVHGANMGGGLAGAMVDSTGTVIRVKANVQDIGTQKMEELEKQILRDIHDVWGDSKYTVQMTGASITFSKGTQYIRNSLFLSIGLAFIIVAFIMLILFRSKRMVGIALLVNVLPLTITAALMGFFGIPIKPSTVLVFSIAFGNATDDTIHFLAKYRQELKRSNWNIGTSVITTIRETGASMIYTSIVLFCGFSVFIFSQFGGTQALGALVAITLFMVMISNNLLLPSLLLSLERKITKKSFGEPLLQVFNEEEDIEISELQINSNSANDDSTEEA
ncbi:MAG: MMPL family transporter [Bacteroidales bacterium]|jgi:predicted RND superfamily exporter protein|nr:MMPL family transporter [Bacteroidales bacterium]